MEPLPDLLTREQLLSYHSTRPALLAAQGSMEHCFTPAEARNFFAALNANGFAILGFEIWHKTDDGYAMDVEEIWTSHGSDARWNYADAANFLRINAPKEGDLVTIQFADPAA